MSCIFDIGAEYRETNEKQYTRKHLIEVLDFSEGIDSNSDNAYRMAVDCCEKLFPITFKRKLPEKDPNAPKIPRKSKKAEKAEKSEQAEGSKKIEKLKDRFEYLQFLYYIIMKNSECERKDFSVSEGVKNPTGKRRGASVFTILEIPSERYLSVYNKMISEIQKKVSKSVREITDGFCDDKSESTLPSKDGYDDSIHTIQQFTNLIASTLMYAYDFGDEALKILECREDYFRKEMKRLKDANHPKVHIETCWDELYLRLHYNKCMYWEQDMLSAYQEVAKAAIKPPSKQNKMFPMQEEKGRELTLEGNCFLILNSSDVIIEEIRNSSILTEDTSNGNDPYTVSNLDLYITALEKYIDVHKEEIARKTFHTEKVDAAKRRIQRQSSKVCEYLRMELQRYGRNSCLTKAKLISAFQAYFLCLSGAGPEKRYPAKAQTPSGLVKEKDSLSSTYSNASEKEPYNIQLICTWTNYQFLWNTQGSFFAQKYLETNILTLEAMLAVGYQSGMENIQLHAEKVLLATMESLIPDEDGQDQLECCINELSIPRRRIILCDPYEKSLHTFGKFCKLFGPPPIISLIEKKLNTDKHKFIRIALEQATENALRIHSPTLEIRYYAATNVYALQNFDIINTKITNPQDVHAEGGSI